MKHCKTGRQFGRVRSQRKALMRSLMSNLIINGRIKTTLAKAKETKSDIDRVITKAKRAKDNRMEAIRKIENDISPEAVQILLDNISKFDARKSGYARVIKLSPRKSDGAEMAILELIDLQRKDSVNSKKEEVDKKVTDSKKDSDKKEKEEKESK